MSTEIIDTLAFQASLRPLPHPPVQVVLPPVDTPEPDVSEAAELGHADGQCFMIEYRDVKGARSLRRITVRSLRRGAGDVPCLYAKCHERNAMRSFRVDRIENCIDIDGEVHENVHSFMTDTFGMTFGKHQALRTRINQKKLFKDTWQLMLPIIKPHAVLLAAISFRDGFVREVETHAARDMCLDICRDNGIENPELVEKRLTAYIGRMRADGPVIARAIEEVADRPPSEITSLLIAALAVMDADGHRHEKEIELVDALAIELTGNPIT